MIGKLQGVVEYIGDGFVIIMVNGIGYKVFTPEYIKPNAEVSLWIETVVREDSIRLFGFSSLSGQNLFNQLTGVSGIGPKVALAIMGAIKTDTLMSAIATGDAKTIATAPGVGKKMAEKIILELKNKIGGPSFEFCASNSDNISGYRRLEIIDIAQKLVSENPSADVAKLVPIALKEISGNK